MSGNGIRTGIEGGISGLDDLYKDGGVGNISIRLTPAAQANQALLAMTIRMLVAIVARRTLMITSNSFYAMTKPVPGLDGYANYSGWRLPNIRELQTLIDYTKVDPAVDKYAFPETQSDLYWSSAPIKDVDDHAWYVDFMYGHTKFVRQTSLIPGSMDTTTALLTEEHYVRCVRSEM